MFFLLVVKIAHRNLLVPLSRKRNLHRLLPVMVMLLLLSTSCKEDDLRTETVISGKIINPSAEYVALSNFGNVQDTVEVDENGLFSFEYENLESGFYLFSHPGEYQSIYISQGDSIKIRLNTRAFDESMSFTASSAAENNFMLDAFISTENENRDYIKNFEKDPEVFYSFLNEATEAEVKRLKTIAKRKDFEQDFVEKALNSIKLNSYSRLERYPALHYGKRNILEARKLPAKYTDHRKQVDLKDNSYYTLNSFRPYVNALVSNIALNNLVKKSGSSADLSRRGYMYNSEKLRLIDSIFDSKEPKELFASNITKNFIRDNRNRVEVKKLVDDFKKIVTNQELIGSIEALAGRYEELEPGKKLSDLDLMDIYNEDISLTDRIDGLSVLFFWSDRFPDYAVRVHKKVKDLRVKYPEIDFIGINTDNQNQESWKQISEKYRFDMNMEYMLENFDDAATYLELKGRNRTLIIEDDLTIVDPDVNLFHYRIETTLLGYLNR
ncbi:hypothetical protein BST97_00885 [Nonlabens spongiae]|uniref:Thioredoxin domain-containing protein n=1 Tax=Nonlabens spongiae TaxID=331648 RepID=A0A1W6MGH2_9FLAO|nr:hypothetical protein [Nonlabens spongiae]ARN76672.1 hypothetical protein BST97_00885 [Nonlabens spongiae]